jgi:hypothetical protein
VTLALIHGGQPDALCSATSRRVRTCAACRLQAASLEALRELSLSMARMVNPDV